MPTSHHSHANKSFGAHAKLQIVKYSWVASLEKCYIAGLEGESCGDVKCMSFMDGCSYVQSVKNFGVENPIWYFLPAKTSSSS